MRKHTKRLVSLFCCCTLALGLMPAMAFADGAAEVTYPSSEGVTNPAASVELVDPAADATYYLYQFDGDDSILDFSGEKYPCYNYQHTVTVKVVGEDPTKPCDDKVGFFSGNECDVETGEIVNGYEIGNYEEIDGVYYTYWTCETKIAMMTVGPAPYTVTTSSMLRYDSLFFPTSINIASSVHMARTSATIPVGGALNLATSSPSGTWTSSDEEVATVTATGTVTGVADGVAIITDTYTAYGLTISGTCTVTVGTGVKAGTGTPTGGGTPNGGNSPSVKSGATYAAGSGVTKAQYKVLNASKKTVAYQKCACNKKNVTVPASVKLKDGKAYKVTQISANAFKSQKKVKTLTVKTKNLTKKTVKGSLKGSKVKTVKSANCSAYKKLFTKAVCGKKVTVKKA